MHFVWAIRLLHITIIIIVWDFCGSVGALAGVRFSKQPEGRPRVRPLSDRHAVSMQSREATDVEHRPPLNPRHRDSPHTRSKCADESGQCISLQLAQVNAKQRLPSSLAPFRLCCQSWVIKQHKEQFATYCSWLYTHICIVNGLRPLPPAPFF